MKTEMPAPIARTLQILVDELGQEHTTIGVLLHGSWATRTASQTSDVDVVCFTDDPAWFRRERREVDGVDVDVQWIPLDKASTDMKTKYIGNENFFLRALSTGVVLSDRDGILEELTQEAKRMQSAPPPKATKDEITIGRPLFINRLKEIEDLIAAGDPWNYLQVLLAVTFNDAVKAFFMVHQQWSDTYKRRLELMKATDETFFALCNAYLSEPSHEAKAAHLQRMLDHVFLPTGWGSPTFRSRRVPIVLHGAGNAFVV